MQRDLLTRVRAVLSELKAIEAILENQPPPPMDHFIPTALQRGILKALDGKAMRTDELGYAVGDRSRLFKANGIRELIDRDIIAHHPSCGYFRPDCPPQFMLEYAGIAA